MAKYFQTDDRDDYFNSLNKDRTYKFVAVMHPNGTISPNWIPKYNFRLNFRNKFKLTRQQSSKVTLDQIFEVYQSKGYKVVLKAFDSCTNLPKPTAEDFI